MPPEEEHPRRGADTSSPPNRENGHMDQRFVFTSVSRSAVPLQSDRASARHDLYIRDGGSCWLCGGAVDHAVPWQHPGSAEIDHVSPKAKGGLDVHGNVRLAHRACNIKKSDLPAETFSPEMYRCVLEWMTFVIVYPWMFLTVQVAWALAYLDTATRNVANVRKQLQFHRQDPTVPQATIRTMEAEAKKSRSELYYARKDLRELQHELRAWKVQLQLCAPVPRSK